MGWYNIALLHCAGLIVDSVCEVNFTSLGWRRRTGSQARFKHSGFCVKIENQVSTGVATLCSWQAASGAAAGFCHLTLLSMKANKQDASRLVCKKKNNDYKNKNLMHRILRHPFSDAEAWTCIWTLLQRCRVWLLPGRVLTLSLNLLFLTPRLFFLCHQEVSFDAWASPVSMGRVSLVCGILLLLSTPLLATGTTTEPRTYLVYVTLCPLPLMIHCGMFPSFTAALGWKFPNCWVPWK